MFRLRSLTKASESFRSTIHCNTIRLMKTAVIRTEPLPPGPWATNDPFLFCVYHKDFYPPDKSGRMEAPRRGNGQDFNPRAPYRMYHGDRVPGFPQHPHRGFETITATMEGLIDHADSVGNAGRYGTGDVQWMTAGGGVVHGEMFPLVYDDKPNHTRFFQIWLNLPAEKKMVKPGFAMFWAENVPKWTSEDGKASVTVWTGDYFGQDNSKNKPPPDSWASDPANDVAILHMTVQPGGQLDLPASHSSTVNRSLYTVEGSFGALVNDSHMQPNTVSELEPTVAVSIQVPSTASEPTEFLLLQGKPISEPIAQRGPFVMNHEHEIRQAILDYGATQFGGWPWPRDDMIFPKEKGRFALMDSVEYRPPLGENQCEESTN